jgi:cytochrome c
MMRAVVFVALFAVAGAAEVRAQDAAAGEKVFGVCKMCHQIGDNAKNAVGPVLNGVIGRKAGSAAGYSYSDANKNSGISWDEAEQKINDLVAFLKQFDADGKKK